MKSGHFPYITSLKVLIVQDAGAYTVKRFKAVIFIVS